MNKLFIIGLPRTGTTSISVALLDYGLKVAHTAFTKKAFELADVVSDAPCFSDYQQLDKLFPNSKFVYLQRELSQWLPSMQMLLKKMQPHLCPQTGHFSPVLKRSFEQTFSIYSSPELHESQHLIRCYQQHQQQVSDYFSNRHDLLSINLSDKNSLSDLLAFIGIKNSEQQQFPKLNNGTQVAAWKAVKHANKINSNSAGIEHRKFFDY